MPSRTVVLVDRPQRMSLVLRLRTSGGPAELSIACAGGAQRQRIDWKREVGMTGSHTRYSIRTTVVAMAAATLALVLIAPSASAATRATARERRDHLEQRAKDQRGVPYRTGGTSPSGFDCSGFTMWVFKKFGVELPHQSESQFDLGKKKNFRRV